MSIVKDTSVFQLILQPPLESPKWSELSLEECQAGSENIIGLPVKIGHEGEVCGEVVESNVLDNGTWTCKFKLDGSEFGKQAHKKISDGELIGGGLRTVFSMKGGSNRDTRTVDGHEWLALAYESEFDNKEDGKGKEDETRGPS